MVSVGEELRRERLLRHVTLQEVAEATKISHNQLEALEQNDFARLPGGVYTRNFIRAYAKYIGASEESMINTYLLQVQQAQSAAEAAPAAEGEPRRGSDAWVFWVIGVGAVVGAFLLLWFFGVFGLGSGPNF